MSKYEELQETLRSRPRTWAVTGAAGFIGSNLLEALLRLDQRVIGLDNFATGRRANLNQVKAAVSASQWSNFRFIEGDIRALEVCRRLCRRPDFVLHHAALGSVPQSIEQPLVAHETNVTGFLNVLEAARGSGVKRVVYASSSAAYGDHEGLPQVEDEIGRPLSPYALTKYANELYAGIFARCYGFDSIGLRYFNVFGPRQDPNGAYAAVIPKWVDAMLRNEPVFVNGDGETVRDFCYVENVVQANLLAAAVDDPAAVNEVYNVALGGRTTLNQLYETIRSLLEPRCAWLRRARPVYRDFRAGDVRLSQAAIDKAQRLLAYEPAWDVSAGLAKTLAWYTAQAPAPAAGHPAVPAAARALGGTLAGIAEVA